MEAAPSAPSSAATPSDDNVEVSNLLKGQVLEAHKTYDELVDTVLETDIESFMENTLTLANSHDEEWRKQYDAITNLRILNKFHYDVLEKSISKFNVFVSV